MSDSQSTSSSGTSTAWQIIGRLVAAAVVLAITAFFTPGFSINNIWSLIIAAVVLTVMDYLIVKFTGFYDFPKFFRCSRSHNSNINNIRHRRLHNVKTCQKRVGPIHVVGLGA